MIWRTIKSILLQRTTSSSGSLRFPIWQWQRSQGARSIQPKFPEISVQNSMDRFGPTGKASKKQVHLLRWSSFPGRTGLNFGWMDRNFHPIRPWKVVGTLYLDSSYVTLKYCAFLSVSDKFILLGHVQAVMMIWVLFLPFFLDSLLAIVSGFIGFSWSPCYFSLSSLQILGSTRACPW